MPAALEYEWQLVGRGGGGGGRRRTPGPYSSNHCTSPARRPTRLSFTPCTGAPSCVTICGSRSENASIHTATTPQRIKPHQIVWRGLWPVLDAVRRLSALTHSIANDRSKGKADGSRGLNPTFNECDFDLIIEEYLRRALAGTTSKEGADFRQLRGGGRQGQCVQCCIQPAAR